MPGFLNVTYDANGGIGGLTDIGLAVGASYTIKTAAEAGISRAGYTFTGWNTQPDGSGTSYAPGSTVMLCGSLTLYAQWTAALNYTVTYEPNGGTGAAYTDTVAAGAVYTFKTNTEVGFTRAGYTFVGWNTLPGGTGTQYSPGDTLAITGDITVYAQWVALVVDYTVIYLPNGGTGNPYFDTAEGSVPYTILTSTQAGFARAGFTFTGWNTQPDGTGTAYAQGTSTLLGSDIALYAQWEAIP